MKFKSNTISRLSLFLNITKKYHNTLFNIQKFITFKGIDHRVNLKFL